MCMSRRDVKSAWEKRYKNDLEPELKRAKENKAVRARLLDVVAQVEKYFNNEVKTNERRAQAQVYLVLGDLERYRLKYGEEKDALKRAVRWYLRAIPLDPDEGRSYGMLATLATMQGESAAAVYWCLRSERAQNKWPGTSTVFSSAAERTKRKLLGPEWHLTAIYVACKTKVSGAGGLRLSIRRLGDQALQSIDENDIERIPKLRATITLSLALEAAEDESFAVRQEIVTLIGTWAKKSLTPNEASASTALFLARFLMKQSEKESNNKSHDTFEQCYDALATFYIYALQKQKSTKVVLSEDHLLDDEAYTLGVLAEPSGLNEHLIQIQLEDNSQQRFHIFLSVCKDLAKRGLLTLHTTARSAARRRQRKDLSSQEYTPQEESDPESLQVPSGASSSETNEDTEDEATSQPQVELPSAAARWLRKSSPTSLTVEPKEEKKINQQLHLLPEEPETSRQNKNTVVVIDGANVAMRYGQGKRFSTKGIAICLDFFKEKYPEATPAIILPEYVLDANKVSAKQRNGRNSRAQEIPDDVQYLKKLQRQGIVHATPAQDYDDSYQIEYARRHHGIIVSNDLFRDAINKLQPQNQADFASWLQSHLISYTFIGDEFIPNPDSRLGQLILLGTHSENGNTPILRSSLGAAAR